MVEWKHELLKRWTNGWKVWLLPYAKAGNIITYGWVGGCYQRLQWHGAYHTKLLPLRSCCFCCKNWLSSMAIFCLCVSVNCFMCLSILSCWFSINSLSWGIKWAMSWENLSIPYANNEGADQPAHPRSLISTFIVRCLDSIISLVSTSDISSL